MMMVAPRRSCARPSSDHYHRRPLPHTHIYGWRTLSFHTGVRAAGGGGRGGPQAAAVVLGRARADAVARADARAAAARTARARTRAMRVGRRVPRGDRGALEPERERLVVGVDHGRAVARAHVAVVVDAARGARGRLRARHAPHDRQRLALAHRATLELPLDPLRPARGVSRVVAHERRSVELVPDGRGPRETRRGAAARGTTAAIIIIVVVVVVVAPVISLDTGHRY